MTAFYNEIDPYAAQWLRNLIAAGHIAPGVVDERSIQDIAPDELKEFTQCHFFAGVGVWSLALRRAGWPDDRPVWTGSCPCQPFSAAGAGAGFSDLRHLWPDFAWQIDQCRPAVVFGEQVASKVIDTWVDLVQIDLETMGYAFGAIPFPSAGVGAPHIRDRLFWVADSQSDRYERPRQLNESARRDGASHLRGIGRMADANGRHASAEREQRRGEQRQQSQDGACRELVGLGDYVGQGLEERVGHAGIPGGTAGAGPGQAVERAGIHIDREPAGPVNGFWRAADWLGCRDDKWRPVEPGPQQMVNGFAQSLGRLCADSIQETIQEIKAHVDNAKADLREALLDVWLSLAEETLQRTSRRLVDVREAPVLLAYLRQLADEGWEVAKGLPCPSEKAMERSLRMLWEQESSSRASRGRELDEQRAKEHSDLMCVLSSVLARHAQASWGESFARYVSDAFPLAVGAKSRTGRLRAYGNAINAEAAQEFIGAYLDSVSTKE